MNLLCLFGKHKYKITRKISHNIQELKCIKCNKEVGINHDLQVVLPLDDELRSEHDFILGIYSIGGKET